MKNLTHNIVTSLNVIVLENLDVISVILQHELENAKGHEHKKTLRNALEILEKEKKKIEEFPELDFDDRIKRLRQAYFKAKHKMKRRTCVMSKSITSSSSYVSGLSDDDRYSMVVHEEVREEDDEEVKYLLCGFSHDGFISLL